jgi:hypothetical protein
MNGIAGIGHNGGPDPIDAATEPHADLRLEVENWLDGALVENEGQMLAVDRLIKDMKGASKSLETARDAATKPLHESWKAEIARWKPTQDDYGRLVTGLVAIVDPFKRKLAAEKDAAKKEAERIAWEKTHAAQEASRVACTSDIEAMRAADRAMAEAEAAKAVAKAAGKEPVKGLFTETRHEIIDGRALINWIAANDRDAITAFITEYARKNCKTLPDDSGVKTWTEKVAK